MLTIIKDDGFTGAHYRNLYFSVCFTIFTLKSCNNGLAMLMWLEFPIISQNAF